MTVDAREINALKLVSVLQHLVAIPLYSLSFPKKFSIKVTPLVGIAVELGREAAVGFGRDDRLNPCVRQRLTQPVRVECSIREKLSA